MIPVHSLIVSDTPNVMHCWVQYHDITFYLTPVAIQYDQRMYGSDILYEINADLKRVSCVWLNGQAIGPETNRS